MKGPEQLLRRWAPAVLVAAMACGGGLRPLPPATAPAPVIPTRRGEGDEGVTPAGRPVPDDDRVLRSRLLMVPVEGITPDRVPDTYTVSRGERGIHAALDLLAPRGTRVLAADAGKVWKLRSNALGGTTIYTIDDTQTFVYYYAHLDRYAVGLREGKLIARGDVLGYVGTTGNAPPNTPHLHFQIMRYRGDGRWWDGEPINPHPFLALPGQVNPQ